jgi:hypothetical protein
MGTSLAKHRSCREIDSGLLRLAPVRQSLDCLEQGQTASRHPLRAEQSKETTLPHTKLSDVGSDRATAYNMSTKIIRRGDELLIGWLDSPASKGEPVRAQLGICDGTSGALQTVISLGGGVDNHCGPAISIDDNGRVHALVGAHHGNFLYRYSDSPADEASWSSPEPIGPCHSYPAFLIDSSGTFHLAYREKGERWQLQYTRRQKGAEWETPVAIAESPTPGYNHYMHSLSVGPTGRLHLTFQFHYSETGVSTDCLSKGMAHIISADGGDSWTNEDTPCTFPLTIQTTNWITSCFDNPSATLRTGTHVADRNDRLWLFASLPDPGRGVMLHQTDEGWGEINLADQIPDLDLSGGKSTAISYDASDRIHLLVGTDPSKQNPGWYHPSNEIFHIAFDLAGTVLSYDQLTETDPERAHWLPSIERWDWCRPGDIGSGDHWHAYTSGIAAGMLNDPNYNDILRTEVFLSKLG